MRHDTKREDVVDWCFENMLQINFLVSEKYYNEALFFLYQNLRIARALVDYKMVIETNRILANLCIKLGQKAKALDVQYFLRDLANDTY